MARTKKEAAADGAFADPANPTLHELNSYTQRLAAPSPVVLEEAGFAIQENGNLTLTNPVISNPAEQPATE